MARDGSSPPRHAAGALGHPGPPSTARRCPGSCRNCPCSPQTPFTSQEILPLFWFICFFIVFVSVIRMTCAKQYLIEHFLMMYFSTFFFFGGGDVLSKAARKTTAQPGQPPAEGAFIAVAAVLCQSRGSPQTAVRGRPAFRTASAFVSPTPPLVCCHAPGRFQAPNFIPAAGGSPRHAGRGRCFAFAPCDGTAVFPGGGAVHGTCPGAKLAPGSISLCISDEGSCEMCCRTRLLPGATVRNCSRRGCGAVRLQAWEEGYLPS